MMDLDYLRYAIDGVKKNQEDLKNLYKDLPKSIQDSSEINKFHSYFSIT